MPKNQPTLFGDSDGPLTLAAVSFGVATILLTALLTWVCFRIKLEGHGSFEVKHWITLAVIFISYGVFIRCIPKAHAGLIASQPQPTDRNYNQIMYGRCLVGLGYFLLLYALLNLVAFAGFAASGHLNSLFPTGKGIENLLDDHPDSTIWITWQLFESLLGYPEKRGLILGIILMVSLGMAILGALFFFANSIWNRMKSSSETSQDQFDERLFWAGLWFRLGEAVLFTIAIFLLLRFNGSTQIIFYLPFFALFIGMSVKSWETLFLGISERLVNAISALVGPSTRAVAVVTPERVAGGQPLSPAENAILAAVRNETVALRFLGIKTLAVLDISNAQLRTIDGTTQITIAARLTKVDSVTKERVSSDVRHWIASILAIREGVLPLISWKGSLDGKFHVIIRFPVQPTGITPK